MTATVEFLDEVDQILGDLLRDCDLAPPTRPVTVPLPTPPAGWEQWRQVRVRRGRACDVCDAEREYETVAITYQASRGRWWVAFLWAPRGPHGERTPLVFQSWPVRSGAAADRLARLVLAMAEDGAGLERWFD